MAVILLVTISSSLESLSLTGLAQALTDAKDFQVKRLERLVSKEKSYRKT
jgi:hypothetical protein